MTLNTETFAAAIPAMTERDRNFAASLLTQWVARGSLSERQMYWANKLAAPKAAGGTKAAMVGNFAAVIALFAKAGESLKFPKVRLALEDGRPVVLAVAGANSKAPGTVNVTDGGSFQNGTWYGRVTPAGAWEMSRKVDANTATAISALLSAFAADPAKVATAYGDKTHRCCFCGLGLTDPRSIEVGYGPICAGNYGLPHGAN